MHRLILTLLLIAQASAQKPAALSDSDKQLLIEELQKVQESEIMTTTKRYDLALAAFKSAVNSDSDTHDLFLNCMEKVQFDDENKKSQEFRDWKRNHKEREDSPGFRLALRHQLNWLTLLLQFTKNPNEPELFTQKAMAAVDAIFTDAEKLENHHQMLEGSVLGSVFARAYKVNNLKTEDIPGSPLDLENIYQKLIFPSLRNPEKYQTLRSAWIKRIKQEGLKLENWSREGSAHGTAPPAYEKWISDGRFDLQWQMEVDCYKAGDEKIAAKNMLAQIQNNLTHKNAAKWIDEFTNMMKSNATLPFKPERNDEPSDEKPAVVTPTKL